MFADREKKEGETLRFSWNKKELSEWRNRVDWSCDRVY